MTVRVPRMQTGRLAGGVKGDTPLDGELGKKADSHADRPHR